MLSWDAATASLRADLAGATEEVARLTKVLGEAEARCAKAWAHNEFLRGVLQKRREEDRLSPAPFPVEEAPSGLSRMASARSTRDVLVPERTTLPSAAEESGGLGEGSHNAFSARLRHTGGDDAAAPMASQSGSLLRKAAAARVK